MVPQPAVPSRAEINPAGRHDGVKVILLDKHAGFLHTDLPATQGQVLVSFDSWRQSLVGVERDIRRCATQYKGGQGDGDNDSRKDMAKTFQPKLPLV